MNDLLDVASQLADLRRQLADLRGPEILEVRIPYAQRALNPFPLASSGGVAGDFAQSTALQVVRFNVSVFVNTTNNGTNYWTIALIDTAGTVLASVNSSGASANTFTRLTTTTITQPGSTNVDLAVKATATGAPGSIYIVPELLIFP